MALAKAQLVSLARVILKNPALLILDEATEVLDPITEAEVLKALDYLMDHRSIIMFIHRMANLTKMDEIIYLKEGKVFERGSHQSLIEKQGAYYHYFQLSKRF